MLPIPAPVLQVMLKRLTLAVALTLLVAPAADARLYQWQDRASGAVQLSGEPPSWYRSGREGPRVLVFERGFLVDDTGIDVSLLRRITLRKQAFEEIEERRALADLKALQEAEERQTRADAREARITERRKAVRANRDAESTEVVAGKAASPLPEVLGEDGVARLKAIITAFDQLRQ